MASEAERYRCREILGNLHLLYGLDSVAVEEEEAFSHAAVCPDCRANLQIAAEVAGLGRRLRVPAKRLPPPADRIPRLVEAGLRENRRRLANAYHEMGRALVIEGAGPTARIEVVKPLKPLAESRLEGAQAIGEARRRRDADLDWGREGDHWRAFHARTELGPLEQAKEALETTLRIEPGQESAVNCIGSLAGFQGRWTDAIQIYHFLEKKTQSIRRYSIALNNRAWVLGEQGNPFEGLRVVKRSLEADPTFMLSALNYFAFAIEVGDFSSLFEAGRILGERAQEAPELFREIRSKVRLAPEVTMLTILAKDPEMLKQAQLACAILFE